MAVVAVGQVVATFFTCRARDIDALATFTRQLGGIHLLKLDASRTAATLADAANNTAEKRANGFLLC